MTKKRISLLVAALIGMHAGNAQHKSYSGIYPNLAMYNNEDECGTGAVVPWNNKLYVITYAPHQPVGSSDKLFIIDKNLNQEVSDKSVGGTPANRMIHKETNSLFIGPYIVDGKGAISVINPTVMPGRHTGLARHLTDPANKIYFATMEEGFYEYDIPSKQVTELYTDVNLKNDRYLSMLPNKKKEDFNFANLFGVHGKGVYSGQGVMVYSNNGEPGELSLSKYDIPAGSLSEWDGKDWKLVRRNQFVEVTGPGGIYGNAKNDDPIWATGWDHKSIILGARDQQQGWKFYRLPKASRSYDGAHGWNTEWPRIRDIEDGTSDYLMTMHGMFWRFPKSFTINNTKGIRPRSSYLKVIGDFARWNNMLVFGCDDSARKEFLNKRKIKGNMEGAGQSNSNLWFLTDRQLDELGPTTAEGAVWINDKLDTDLTSEAFLLAGWKERNVYLKNHNSFPVELTLEVDKKGNNQWTVYKKLKLAANQSIQEAIREQETAEWIRVKASKAGVYSALFTYQGDQLSKVDHALFNHIATDDKQPYSGGLLYALGGNQRKLGVLAGSIQNNMWKQAGYYELDGNMELKATQNAENQKTIEDDFAIPQPAVQVDAQSVLVIDDQGRRWRFPKGPSKFDALTNNRLTRLAREVSTERDLMNLHGTFYELPAENADGFAKVRPVASHQLLIHDFASFRGLFVISGINPVGSQEHIIRSQDGKAAVWVGAIDDLWKLGKPTGKGGPFAQTAVKANENSDPYLFGFYDKKSVTLSHDQPSSVNFSIQLDPSGNGEWIDYKKIAVAGGKTASFDFPAGVEARWIRFSTDKACKATTTLNYD